MSRNIHVSMPGGAMRLRIAALGLIAVPAAVLLLFAFGEMFGGDITGAQHIPEAAVLLVMLVAGWRRPRPTGVVLIVAASLLFVAWFGWVLLLRDDEGGTPASMWIATALLLFLPPLLAGWMLLRSSQSDTPR